MKTLTLKNHVQGNSTIVENDFIDQYMVKANGEYVKVYLLLLRHLQSGDSSLTVSKLADYLECTEKDICRAFKFWEKSGLLKVEYDENHIISGLSFGSTPEPTQKEVVPEPTKKATASVRKATPKQMQQLYFVAEQYLGRTLSSTDLKKINYFHDELNFPTTLIEYLIEHCVDGGNTNMRYIEKVALNWAEEGISTVRAAKASTASYNKNSHIVLSAFGIKGRNPATVELGYIRRWFDEYGMPAELVLEACNRTIANTHQPDFKYADTILKNWASKEVKTLTDVALLDSAYQQKKATMKKPVVASSNKFQNFDGRSYDMTSLEQQLLNTQ